MNSLQQVFDSSKSFQDFDLSLVFIIPIIPFTGGRRFKIIGSHETFNYQNLLNEFQKNVIFKKQFSGEEEKTLFSKITKLNDQANQKLKNSSLITRVFTFIRDWINLHILDSSPEFLTKVSIDIDIAKHIDADKQKKLDTQQKAEEAQQKAEEAQKLQDKETQRQAEVTKQQAEKAKLEAVKQEKEKALTHFLDSGNIDLKNYPSMESELHFNETVEDAVKHIEKEIKLLKDDPKKITQKKLGEDVSCFLKKYWNLQEQLKPLSTNNCDRDDSARINKIEESLNTVLASMMKELKPEQVVKIFIHAMMLFSEQKLGQAKVWFDHDENQEAAYFNQAFKLIDMMENLFKSCIPDLQKDELSYLMDKQVCSMCMFPQQLFRTIYVFKNKLWNKNLKNDQDALFSCKDAVASISGHYFMPGYVLKYIVKEKDLIASALDIKGRQNLFKTPKTNEEKDSFSSEWLKSVFHIFNHDEREEFFPGCTIKGYDSDGKISSFQYP